MAKYLANSDDITIEEVTGTDSIKFNTKYSMDELKSGIENNSNDIDTLKNGENYSTSEITTNKVWYNNKPIYRMVIVVDNITTYGTYTSTGVTISNVDDVTELKSTAKRIPTTNVYAWYMTGTSTESSYTADYITAARFTNGVVEYMAKASSYGIKKMIIIMEYTKTTD